MINRALRVGVCALVLGAIAIAPAQTKLAGLRSKPKQQPQNRQRLLRDGNGVVLLAIKAAEKLRYGGTRVVEYMRGAKKMSHTEYVLKAGPITRVWFPDDSPFAGQIIVENKRERRQFFPAQNAIHVTPARKEELLSRLRALLKNQSFHIFTGPGDVIAGRQTSLVTVSDGKGNVLQRIYIDPRTGMLLKRVLYDPVGAQIGYFEFTQIDYSPSYPASWDTLERKGAKIITPEDIGKDLAKKNDLQWVMIPASENMPLENVQMRKINNLQVLHQAYQTGHGQLSLFEVKGSVDLSEMSRRRNREVQFYGWQQGGHTFALVGNMSQLELKRIAHLLGDRGNV